MFEMFLKPLNKELVLELEAIIAHARKYVPFTITTNGSDFINIAGITGLYTLGAGYVHPEIHTHSTFSSEIILVNTIIKRSSGAYIKSFLHELSHATGYSSRLNRVMFSPDESIQFSQSQEYIFEELVAETTAQLLMDYFNLSTEDTTTENARYILRHRERLTEENVKRANEEVLGLSVASMSYILSNWLINFKLNQENVA